MLIFIKSIPHYALLIRLIFVSLVISTPAFAENTDDARLTPSNWSYATDPYGSEALIRGNLVSTDGVLGKL